MLMLTFQMMFCLNTTGTNFTKTEIVFKCYNNNNNDNTNNHNNHNKICHDLFSQPSQITHAQLSNIHPLAHILNPMGTNRFLKLLLDIAKSLRV